MCFIVLAFACSMHATVHDLAWSRLVETLLVDHDRNEQYGCLLTAATSAELCSVVRLAQVLAWPIGDSTNWQITSQFIWWLDDLVEAWPERKLDAKASLQNFGPRHQCRCLPSRATALPRAGRDRRPKSWPRFGLVSVLCQCSAFWSTKKQPGPDLGRYEEEHVELKFGDHGLARVSLAWAHEHRQEVNSS